MQPAYVCAGDVLLICRPTSCGKAAYAPLEMPVEVDLGVHRSPQPSRAEQCFNVVWVVW